jgi:uncharacterized Zn finger protein
MNFTCPYCGDGSFVITTGGNGAAPLATCNQCSKVIPFDKNLMTNAPVSETAQARPPARSNRIH